jgi:c-di-AMP phosphodiesterase-like protein
MRANIKRFLQVKKDPNAILIVIECFAYIVKCVYYAMLSGFVTLKTVLVLVYYFISVEMIYQLYANHFFKYLRQSA